MQQITIVRSPSNSIEQQNFRFPVRRRNFTSGLVEILKNNTELNIDEAKLLWQQNEPIFLPALLCSEIEKHRDELQISQNLYQSILDETDIDDIFSQPVYEQRLGKDFELLCSRFDASDEQEIVSVDFDIHDQGELIEDVWMRVSWLSFEEGDSSLRFRFSFGMEGYEDVSQDLRRQLLAAELEQRIFPESSMLADNPVISEQIENIINSHDFKLLERIVYFNAPNGGAQFHHDAEKGHIGVVYAQVSGKTFWLALSKSQLNREIVRFIADEENRVQFLAAINKQNLDSSFVEKLNDREFIEQVLNDLFHPELELLLNSNKAFFEQLVTTGYAYYLEPGDVLLLPQESMANCAWHSVFCLGEVAGQALSFAIKRFD